MAHVVHYLSCNLLFNVEAPIIIWLWLYTTSTLESYAIIPRWWKNKANLPLCYISKFSSHIRQFSSDVGHLPRTHMLVLIGSSSRWNVAHLLLGMCALMASTSTILCLWDELRYTRGMYNILSWHNSLLCVRITWKFAFTRRELCQSGHAHSGKTIPFPKWEFLKCSLWYTPVP